MAYNLDRNKNETVKTDASFLPFQSLRIINRPINDAIDNIKFLKTMLLFTLCLSICLTVNFD